MLSDGTRRFRYAYVEIARKNGKTALSAGIGLYMLFADGESRPEVYSAATVKDQAKICFSDAAEIVKATDLKKYLSVFRNAITYEAKGGMLKPLSSDYGTHDGLNPSCGIIDEFHAHKDSGMFDVIKSAFGARRQPLMFIITTAGFNKAGACFAYRDNVIKVLRGVNRDDSLSASSIRSTTKRSGIIRRCGSRPIPISAYRFRSITSPRRSWMPRTGRKPSVT